MIPSSHRAEAAMRPKKPQTMGEGDLFRAHQHEARAGAARQQGVKSRHRQHEPSPIARSAPSAMRADCNSQSELNLRGLGHTIRSLWRRRKPRASRAMPMADLHMRAGCAVTGDLIACSR
jgi:hypothetical protein